MSRLPLAEPDELPAYLRDLHDGARDDDWSTRHVARAFPWHSNDGLAPGAARTSPRLKELVRLRIATLNGCHTCKAARLAADSIPEAQALGIDAYAASDDYSPAEKAAVAFAEQMAVEHHAIGVEDIARLREHFDDGAILELMMMAGQYIGFGRLLAILQLETVQCPLPARAA